MVDNVQNELAPTTVALQETPQALPEQQPDTEFTHVLQNTIDDYYDLFVHKLPPAHDQDGQSLDSLYDLDPDDIDTDYHPYDFSQLADAAKGLDKWNTESFPKLLTHCQKPVDRSKLSDEQQRLLTLQADLRHDLAGDILSNLIGGITDDEFMYEELGYIGNPYMIQFPLQVMERIYKQTTNTPDVKPIHGQNAIQYIAGVFITKTLQEKNKFTYDIDYQTPFELNGDFDYLLGVLANPLNNIKQIGKEKGLKDIRSMIRILPDPDHEDRIIIQIRDNIGGMPDELLGLPDGSDTPRALQRGETRRKSGTGAGLAIVNEIVKDHFHGSISLKNEPYPETDQQGLVMNISLPGKLTAKASE